MKIDDYLKRLKSLRDEHSDSIPDEMLIGTKDRTRYKVKKSWFQLVIADAQNIILDGYASERSAGLFYGMLDYFEETRFSNRFLTEREDIVKANSLLSSLINDMKNYTASAGSSAF